MGRLITTTTMPLCIQMLHADDNSWSAKTSQKNKNLMGSKVSNRMLIQLSPKIES